MKIAVVIPTLNGGETFKQALGALLEQSLPPDVLVVIDSGSKDDTLATAMAAGAKISQIRREDFNHGATRNSARSLVEADFYIFLTQDAVPANRYTLENLVKPFVQHREVGLTYARQIPRPEAGPIETFSRLFSYSDESKMKTRADSKQLGLETVLCSNSCAAYRREAFDSVNGFPTEVAICEDVYIAAKMLQAGYNIYYEANALIYHSHDYSLIQEFKRYFDIGIFYESRERWIIKEFGGSGRRGFHMFFLGLKYLNNNRYQYLCPEWVMRTLVKIIGYNLGAKERYLPRALNKHFSMYNNYWKISDG